MPKVTATQSQLLSPRSSSPICSPVTAPGSPYIDAFSIGLRSPPSTGRLDLSVKSNLSKEVEEEVNEEDERVWILGEKLKSLVKMHSVQFEEGREDEIEKRLIGSDKESNNDENCTEKLLSVKRLAEVAVEEKDESNETNLEPELKTNRALPNDKDKEENKKKEEKEEKEKKGGNDQKDETYSSDAQLVPKNTFSELFAESKVDSSSLCSTKDTGSFLSTDHQYRHKARESPKVASPIATLVSDSSLDSDSNSEPEPVYSTIRSNPRALRVINKVEDPFIDSKEIVNNNVVDEVAKGNRKEGKITYVFRGKRIEYDDDNNNSKIFPVPTSRLLWPTTSPATPTRKPARPASSTRTPPLSPLTIYKYSPSSSPSPFDDSQKSPCEKGCPPSLKAETDEKAIKQAKFAKNNVGKRDIIEIRNPEQEKPYSPTKSPFPLIPPVELPATKSAVPPPSLCSTSIRKRKLADFSPPIIQRCQLGPSVAPPLPQRPSQRLARSLRAEFLASVQQKPKTGACFFDRDDDHINPFLVPTRTAFEVLAEGARRVKPRLEGWSGHLAQVARSLGKRKWMNDVDDDREVGESDETVQDNEDEEDEGDEETAPSAFEMNYPKITKFTKKVKRREEIKSVQGEGNKSVGEEIELGKGLVGIKFEGFGVKGLVRMPVK